MKFPKQRLGPTLTALVAEFRRDRGSDLFSLVDPVQNKFIIAECRNEHHFELIGRSHDACYFGVPPTGAEPVDARVVVAVDNKGMDPKVVADNLADYLSICAYSIAYGTNPAEWRALENESMEDDDFNELRKRLCTLPGVSVPAAPWKLTRSDPWETESPPPSAPNIPCELESIFERDLAKLRLLLLFDGASEAKGKTTIAITIDGPRELAKVLPSHPLVIDALRAYGASLRKRFPGRKFKLEISYDSLVPDDLTKAERASTSWRGLEVALRLAGKSDVYEQLLRHPKSCVTRR